MGAVFTNVRKYKYVARVAAALSLSLSRLASDFQIFLFVMVACCKGAGDLLQKKVLLAMKRG